MTSRFSIFPEWGLTYIWHEGRVPHDDTVAMLRAFSQDPDLRPGMKHLIDFSTVTWFEHDPSRLLELQSFMAGVVRPDGGEALMVLLANSAVSREMAQPLLQFWSTSPHVRPRLVSEASQAFDILGLPELTLRQLREKVVT